MAGPSDAAQLFGSEQAGWDAVSNQMAQIAAGRGLQALQIFNQQQMPSGIPPGAGPMPTQLAASPTGGSPGMGPPPMGGMPPQRPPMPQGGPPMGGPSMGGQPPPQMQPGAGGPPQGQMPPQMGPPPMQGGMMGGIPGAYSLPQIVQAVQHANPGAPPQVLFKAVAGLMPLMRPSDQEYFKLIAAQQAQQRLEQGQQRLGQGQEKIGIQAQQAGLSAPGPGGATPPQQNPDVPQGDQQLGGVPPPKNTAEQIADDIHTGKQAPVFGGWGGMGVPVKMAPAVRAAYAQRYPNDNLAQKALQWQQEVKLVQTMGGPQQVRFRQLANSVKPFLSDIEQLSRQMNLSGMNAWNAAQIKTESELRGNTERGQLATRYLTALAGVRGEIAQLEQGGYAPHDASWQVAYQQVNQDRGVQAQLAALSEIKKIIQYRIEGMDAVAPGMAPGSPNPYAPGGGGAQPSQNVIRYDAQGNRIGQ